jgi:hypothetical protein
MELRRESVENGDFSGPEGEFKNCNYSPDFLDFRSNFITTKAISAHLLSCHPLVGGAFLW